MFDGQPRESRRRSVDQMRNKSTTWDVFIYKVIPNIADNALILCLIALGLLVYAAFLGIGYHLEYTSDDPAPMIPRASMLRWYLPAAPAVAACVIMVITTLALRFRRRRPWS